MTITEAEGFTELAMWQDAWDAIEALDPEEKATPRALRCRLACCPQLGAWGIGEHVAGLLRDGRDADRIAAASFYHHSARRNIALGNRAEAKKAVTSAVEAWPACRVDLLGDEMLVSELF